MSSLSKILAATTLVAGALSLSATAHASSVSFASSAPNVTYTVLTGNDAGKSGTSSGVGAYANTVAGAQWVSYDPNTESATGDPIGTTAYTFNLTGDYTGASGSITVAADDIATVILNGVTLGSTMTPYDTLTTFNFTLGSTNTNTFEFDVNNSGAGPTALVFGGSAATPEPSSLVLLGSGLVSAAGMVIRKRRA